MLKKLLEKQKHIKPLEEAEKQRPGKMADSA